MDILRIVLVVYFWLSLSLMSWAAVGYAASLAEDRLVHIKKKDNLKTIAFGTLMFLFLPIGWIVLGITKLVGRD